MPAYSKLTDQKELEMQHRSGETALTRQLNKLLARADIRNHPHLPELLVPGHMDLVDDGCRQALGIDSATVDHLNNEWPNDQKERVRIAVAEAIELGKPVVFSWHLSRSKAEQTEIEEEDATLRVVFLAPRHKALAAIRANRERNSRLAISPTLA